MKAWLRQHRFALADAFSRLLRHPGNFAFNTVVVAIALLLPFAGLTLLESLRPVSGELAVDPEISVFLAVDTPRERATAMGPEIRKAIEKRELAGKVEFISREDALERLKGRTGLSESLQALGTNPLPDAYALRLGKPQGKQDVDRIQALATDLKSLPDVEHVQIDSAWVKRLAALLHLLHLMLGLLAATLAVVVIAVVFNTIRLQVLTQRAEIEISRLVGATDSFIYRPFYYSGMLLGLGAGLLALGGVAWSLQPLNNALADFARLYASEFRLAPLDLWPSLALLAGSTFLGLTGAILSVRRQLARTN